MKIDLSQLFNEQNKLDKEIHKNHNVTYKTIANELKLALLVELSELANEIRCFKFWSNKPSSPRDVILEEYVDGIHFIMSICISNKVKPYFIVSECKKFNNKKEITKQLIELTQKASVIKTSLQAKNWYANYLKFGFRLGFSLKNITDAYYKKNQINHNRQKNNY